MQFDLSEVEELFKYRPRNPIEHFTEAYCWSLAVALHELIGESVWFFFTTMNVDRGHMVVGDGDTFMDIRGVHTYEEMMAWCETQQGETGVYEYPDDESAVEVIRKEGWFRTSMMGGDEALALAMEVAPLLIKQLGAYK